MAVKSGKKLAGAKALKGRAKALRGARVARGIKPAKATRHYR
jgi:hypothetical protein